MTCGCAQSLSDAQLSRVAEAVQLQVRSRAGSVSRLTLVDRGVGIS